MADSYDLVLIEYPDGHWSAELINVVGLRPGTHLVTDTNPLILVERHARELVSSATGADLYEFDLRFLSPDGRVLATSTITSNPRGRHHHEGTSHEDVFLADELLDRLRTSVESR